MTSAGEKHTNVTRIGWGEHYSYGGATLPPPPLTKHEDSVKTTLNKSPMLLYDRFKVGVELDSRLVSSSPSSRTMHLSPIRRWSSQATIEDHRIGSLRPPTASPVPSSIFVVVSCIMNYSFLWWIGGACTQISCMLEDYHNWVDVHALAGGRHPLLVIIGNEMDTTPQQLDKMLKVKKKRCRWGRKTNKETKWEIMYNVLCLIKKSCHAIGETASDVSRTRVVRFWKLGDECGPALKFRDQTSADWWIEVPEGPKVSLHFTTWCMW